MTNYVPRELTDSIEKALNQMPVVILSGLRQTGKSTLLLHDPRFSGRKYISLDDFAVLTAANQNPEGLLQNEEAITLDEAQKCHDLLTVIKIIVDRKRKHGRFLLSGSANLALLGHVTETLAGRAIYLTLQPFSRREIYRRIQKPPFLKEFIEKQMISPEERMEPIAPNEILLGGMPLVCGESLDNAWTWFKGYEQTYIERDVRQLSQITDLVSFRTLAQLAALRTGQIFKISELARDAKLNAATASRYLHLLETSFLIRRIPPFLKNRSQRLIKSPKLYVTDSGLACYLAGVRSLDPLADETMLGALMETYVVQNLTAILEAHVPDAQVFFWNEQGRYEVDLVIELNRKVIAIETKSGTRWDRGDLAGLHAFMERTPQCVASVLAYNGTETVSLGPKLWAIPIGRLLS